MGSSGDKPRKPRRHLPKVPRGMEPNNIQLGGLSEGGDGGGAGPRLGHDYAHGRSYDLGKFGTFVLWCLGRRRKNLELENEQKEQVD